MLLRICVGHIQMFGPVLDSSILLKKYHSNILFFGPIYY